MYFGIHLVESVIKYPGLYGALLFAVLLLLVLLLLLRWSRKPSSDYEPSTNAEADRKEMPEIPFSDFNSRLSTSFPCPVGLPLAIDDPGAQYFALRIDAAVEEVSGNLRTVVAAIYPGVPDEEMDWMLLELKRFFFMSAIAGRIPTYGYRVNYLWKQLTQDPEAYAKVLDALPEGLILEYREPEPAKDGFGHRAEFETIYRYLFEVNEVNEQLIGSFYPKPSRHLAPKYCKDIREMKNDALIAKYFNIFAFDSQMVPVISGVIDHIREQVKEDPVYSYEPIRGSRQTNRPSAGRRNSGNVSRSSGYSGGGDASSSGSGISNNAFMRGMLVGSMMTDSGTGRGDCSSEDRGQHHSGNDDSGSRGSSDYNSGSSGGGYDGGSSGGYDSGGFD